MNHKYHSGLLGATAGALLFCACSSGGSSFGTSGGGSGHVDPGAGTGAGDLSGGGGGLGGGATTNGGAPPSGGAPTTDGGTSPAGGGVTMGGAGGVAPSGGAGGTAEACPKPAGQICHEFFANDNSRNEVHYVNEFNPTKNWTVKAGDTGQNSPRGLQLVDNKTAKTGKAILVSIDKGFAEFDVVGGAQLLRVGNFGSVTSALRIPSDSTTNLPPGTTVLARDLNPTELDFVGPTGTQVVPAVKMPFAAAGGELRKLERNPTTGHFSFTKYESASTAYIYEVTEQGNLVSKLQLPVGGKGYNALWRDGGGMIATTGSLASVVTLDSKGAVLASVGGAGKLKDSSGAAIYTDFFSGFFLLPNGNVVAANWLGHVNPSSHPTTPELLEITPANQVVWSWGNQSLATWITYGYFLR